MSRWPTAKHFTSWLTLAPGSKISGGKVLSSKTRRSSNRAAHLLRLAAVSVGRTSTALGAFYRRLAMRVGKAGPSSTGQAAVPHDDGLPARSARRPQHPRTALRGAGTGHGLGHRHHIWTVEGWLYLVVILNLFSRRIVGWSTSERITRQLGVDASDKTADELRRERSPGKR